MQRELQQLLDSLRREREAALGDRRREEGTLQTATEARRRAARLYLRALVPDLGDGTLRAIRRDVPGFEPRTVAKWLGVFGEKLDPSVSVDHLRMQLGTFLDNTPNPPTKWMQEVAGFDDTIRHYQQTVIPASQERLENVNARIEALERLATVDFQKMDADMRDKLGQAITVQSPRMRDVVSQARMRPASRPVSYPTSSQIRSDDGPDLLTMWLWYQLLTPHSECARAVEQASFVPGGGAYGGGGATGSYAEEGRVEVAPRDLDTSSIETHLAAGAAQFS